MSAVPRVAGEPTVRPVRLDDVPAVVAMVHELAELGTLAVAAPPQSAQSTHQNVSTA